MAVVPLIATLMPNQSCALGSSRTASAICWPLGHIKDVRRPRVGPVVVVPPGAHDRPGPLIDTE